MTKAIIYTGTQILTFQIFDENLTIDEICAPLKKQGEQISIAWIEDEEEN